MSYPKDAVWYLRVEHDRAESVIVLTLAGRVSHRTCPELEAALSAAMTSGAAAVVVDLSAVDYISSPGLRALDAAATRLSADGRRLVVCGVQDAVSVAFDLGGLSATLAVAPSREAAVASAAGRLGPEP